MKLIIVSGLSGAGKTVALKQFEDLGYATIDNIPLALLAPMISRLVAKADPRYERLAIGLDARESSVEIARFPQHLARLRKRRVDVHVLFLTASDEILLQRYGATRRPHPLADGKISLADAIAREREWIAPIANLADEPLDTSEMNLYQLREALHERLPEAAQGKLAVQFLSFGFKNGVPSGCDFLFDVRCLPNPHWMPDLQPLTGRDHAVQSWFDQQEAVGVMLKNIGDFLAPWLPVFRRQERAYVTVGVGCTGGQHRSVYLVEKLGERFSADFDPVVINHKELR